MQERSATPRVRATASPPREEWPSLRPELTGGELRLASFVDDHLPPVWEIYVQPFLNGVRPDVVVLHPHVGIAVSEVRDWSVHHDSEDELGAMTAHTGGGVRRVRHPVNQARRGRRRRHGRCTGAAPRGRGRAARGSRGRAWRRCSCPCRPSGRGWWRMVRRPCWVGRRSPLRVRRHPIAAARVKATP